MQSDLGKVRNLLGMLVVHDVLWVENRQRNIEERNLEKSSEKKKHNS